MYEREERVSVEVNPARVSTFRGDAVVSIGGVDFCMAGEVLQEGRL